MNLERPFDRPRGVSRYVVGSGVLLLGLLPGYVDLQVLLLAFLDDGSLAVDRGRTTTARQLDSLRYAEVSLGVDRALHRVIGGRRPCR